MGKSKKWKRPKFKKMTGDLYKTKYGWGATCPDNLDLGENADIGFGTYINARYGVVIEEDVQIGGGCKIYSHNTINNVKGLIRIESNAKIGANSVILPNVLIKINQLIPACSVVFIKDGVMTIKRVSE